MAADVSASRDTVTGSTILATSLLFPAAAEMCYKEY